MNIKNLEFSRLSPSGRFGLNMCGKSARNSRDFNWAFGLNRLSLQLMGIWPDEAAAAGSDGECPPKMKVLRIPLMVLWMIVGLFLPQMYALSQVFRELPLLVDNLTTSCAALTSCIKLALLWNSRHGRLSASAQRARCRCKTNNRPFLRDAVSTPVHPEIESLVRSVARDYSRSRSARDEAAMARQARRARLFTISGYAIMFVCFVGFVSSPFFGLSIRIVNNITDQLGGRFLPLQTYYPYEFQRSPHFELTYLSQVVAGSLVGLSFSVPDNFFGALLFHASAQCELLSDGFGELLPRRPERTERALFRAKLRRLVRQHVRLIRFVDDLERSFNLLILAQVLCLSLVICCLGFGVINSVRHEDESPPFVQIATLVGTLLNLMIHMLVYCIASEILAENSLGFVQSVYSSDWYRLPASYSRDTLPVMIRSQSPLRLTAGKFFHLSLNAYLKILKSSAGYISMLLAVAS